MRMRAAVAGVLVAGLSLSGCARPDAPRPIPIEGDSISYETGPCLGRCPVYSVTIRPDGGGVFVGKRHTAVSGERAFKVSPADYAAFAARLQPYRPASGERRYEQGKPGCRQIVTDMPSVAVRWTRAIGDSQALYYYFGCNPGEATAIGDALGGAPDALPPLEALIGELP